MPPQAQDGPLAIGEIFLGKYEILKLIGRGGHACVYHALNSFMGRDVAIKVLYRPGGVDRDALRRGQAEAQLLSRLRDPNIVEVIDAGMTEEGLLYIVMELLTGCSLRQLLHDRGALPVDEVLRLAAEIADGVHAAHETGAIHRDLKPENVFVTETGTIKILDFGIAKLADAAALTTETDTAHGTALYMSPEQLQLAKLTPRSDVYALGVVMFEALAGRHPVPLLIDAPVPTVWEISRAVLTREPPMLDELDARIPRSVAMLVNRAMAKLPEQRFATMAELAAATRDCRDAWVAYAKVHGLPLTERHAAPNPRSASGYPRSSEPPPPAVRASASPLPTPGTAAPVTTVSTAGELTGARPIGARQVLLLGVLVGSVKAFVVIGGSVLSLAAVGVGVAFTVKSNAAGRDADALFAQLVASSDPSLGATNSYCSPPPPATPPAECSRYTSRKEDQESAKTVAIAAYVTGGALAAGTLITYLLWPKESGSASLPRLEVAKAGPDGVLMNLRLGF